MSNVTATQSSYFAFIENTARNYLAECVERVGCDLDDVLEEAAEGLHELAGSLEIAIYYHHHLPIIQYSTYSDEFVCEFGAECAGDILKDKGLNGLHAAIAEYCIWGDLNDRINDEVEDYIESVLATQDIEDEE
jgi:hypothetical protein